MLSRTEQHLSDVDSLIRDLESDDPCTLEQAAELLACARDDRAVEPLLRRLGSRAVQRNDGVEDAFCAALTALGVMTYGRGRWYALLPAHELAPHHRALIHELDCAVPLRYFLRRARISQGFSAR
jgi:hypothetical protein